MSLKTEIPLNIMKKVLVTVFVFAIFTIGVNQAFGSEIKYEFNGVMVRNNPTICSIQPIDNDLTEIQLEKFSAQTKYSISEWQQHLQQKGGKNAWSNWEITHKHIDYDKLNSDTILGCDIIMVFSKTPPSLDFWGILGLAMSDYETGKTIIEIYYSIPQLCDTGERKEDPSENIIWIIQVPCYGDMMIADQLGSVIRHEMGHGLGLGHYMSTDEQITLDWNKGLSPTPSIMVQTSYENSDELRISPKDIDKLFEIYGQDGFILNPEEKKNLTLKDPYIVEQNYVDYTNSDYGFSLQYPEKWGVEKNVSTFDEYTRVLYMTDQKDNPFRTISVGFYNKSIVNESSDQIILDQLNQKEKKYCDNLLNENNDIDCENIILVESKIQNDSNRKVYSQKYLWNDGANYHIMKKNYIIASDKIWEITGDGLLAPSLLTQNVMDQSINSFKLDIAETENNTTTGFKPSEQSQIESPINAEPPRLTQIPDWVRGNAKWWSQGAIGDSDFISGIQYLIKERIMIIPETAKGEGPHESKVIPSWIKNNAEWWAQSLISDDDFIKGIQYLVENGIITV